MLKGVFFGIGLLIVFIPFLVMGYFFLEQGGKEILHMAKSKVAIDYNPFYEVIEPSKRIAPNFNGANNPYLNKPFRLPNDYLSVSVNSVEELMKEIYRANKNNGHRKIILEDGIYHLKKPIMIKAEHVALVSKSASPNSVIIKANGMHEYSNARSLIKVVASYFTLDGITLQGARNHLIQIAGEFDADYPVLRNCVLRDSSQQLVKVSYDKKNRPKISSDFGLVENCEFYYSEGIGPNYYIGGLDAHAVNGWIIRNNLFKDIASPSGRIAEHAIHIWNNSFNPIIINNKFIDNDRAIGLGMISSNAKTNIIYSNKGGLIKNNQILHTDNNDPFADTGIILEDSPLTEIIGNRIWMGHKYPRAIEYRFKNTVQVLIKDNITNKEIKSRDGGMAVLKNNKITNNKSLVLSP